MPYFLAALTFLAALILTRLMCRIAPRLGLVDRPDGQRKLHRRATPVSGGVAVFLAVCFTLANAFAFSTAWRATILANWREAAGLLLGSLVVITVGLLDDRFTLRGRQKLLGQLLAASVLIGFGLRIEQIGLFGYKLELGVVGGILFTLFWLLGAINALNLLDGVDGVATSVGMVLTVAIAAMAFLTHHAGVGMVAILFASALAGFLVFNFPPARIFLGDAGSMLIGLVVGSLAILASLKSAGTCLLIAPLAVWAIPIMDSGGAIVRRRLTGRSIYTTDRGHFHHRLLDRFGSAWLVIVVIASCCMVTAAGALASIYFNNDGLALLTVSGMGLILVVSRAFGRVELWLLANRTRSLISSFVTLRRNGKSSSHESIVQIQGSEQWLPVWSPITQLAERSRLSRVELNISLPALHEGFHALWTGVDVEHPDLLWRMDIPLSVDGQCFGWLKASAENTIANRRDVIDDLLQATVPIEQRLGELVAGAAPVQSVLPVEPKPTPRLATSEPRSPVTHLPSS